MTRFRSRSSRRISLNSTATGLRRLPGPWLDRRKRISLRRGIGGSRPGGPRSRGAREEGHRRNGPGVDEADRGITNRMAELGVDAVLSAPLLLQVKVMTWCLGRITWWWRRGQGPGTHLQHTAKHGYFPGRVGHRRAGPALQYHRAQGKRRRPGLSQLSHPPVPSTSIMFLGSGSVFLPALELGGLRAIPGRRQCFPGDLCQNLRTF